MLVYARKNSYSFNLHFCGQTFEVQNLYKNKEL